MVGRLIKFMVIIVVFIMFVFVVSKVLIIIMVKVNFFGIWLKSIVIVLSNCFVRLDFLSIIFMKIKSGMVISFFLDMIL